MFFLSFVCLWDWQKKILDKTFFSRTWKAENDYKNAMKWWTNNNKEKSKLRWLKAKKLSFEFSSTSRRLCNWSCRVSVNKVANSSKQTIKRSTWVDRFATSSRQFTSFIFMYIFNWNRKAVLEIVAKYMRRHNFSSSYLTMCWRFLIFTF